MKLDFPERKRRLLKSIEKLKITAARKSESVNLIRTEIDR